MVYAFLSLYTGFFFTCENFILSYYSQRHFYVFPCTKRLFYISAAHIEIIYCPILVFRWKLLLRFPFLPSLHLWSKSAGKAIEQLNRAPDEIYAWYPNSRHTSHLSWVILLCRTNPPDPLLPINLGGSAIAWVTKSRLLAIAVDDKLSWLPHLLELKKSFADKLTFLPESLRLDPFFKVILPSSTWSRLIGLVL